MLTIRKSKMFSCRLTPGDYALLVNLLRLGDTHGIYGQDSFRSLLRELGDRLYRNSMGDLRLRPGAGEMSDVEIEASNQLVSQITDIF